MASVMTCVVTPAGLQQHGASLPPRGEADPSAQQAQPQRGGGGAGGQPQRPQGPGPPLLAGGLPGDVSVAVVTLRERFPPNGWFTQDPPVGDQR